MRTEPLWQARDLILARSDDVCDFEGQSIRGVECCAEGLTYLLSTNYGWEMDLAYLHWQSGEREVRATCCNSREPRMHNMCNRLRVSVNEAEDDPTRSWMELMQARLDDRSNPDRPTKKKATAVELLEGAGGLHPSQVFRKLGASFGTRAEVLGDTSSRRDISCVAFPGGNLLVPPIAFVLTRVLPVWNRYAG